MGADLLTVIWFFVVMALMTGYVILDGFDLGVGMLHLMARGEEERRIMLNTIGPVWDGNEVWLVTAGGALFAGFPLAYATLCSAFYLLVIFFLFALIFRAVAIEFRSTLSYPFWKSMWDVLFSVASMALGFGLGVVLGNLVQGIPLNAFGEFTGEGMGLFFSPYALLMGGFASSIFLLHGLLYVLLKTKGAVYARMRRLLIPGVILFMGLYIATTMMTWIYAPHMLKRMWEEPMYFLFVLANGVAIIGILWNVYHRREGKAFIASCLNLVFLMTLYGIGMFPYLIRASSNPSFGLTIYEAASSPLTLSILLLIAVIGVPLVLAYTFTTHWIFRGKIGAEHIHY